MIGWAWLRRLAARVLPCRHTDRTGASRMYRERRRLPGTKLEVLHLVCDRCGHAQPMVDRAVKDQKRVTSIGTAASRMRGRKASAGPGELVDINVRRRAGGARTGEGGR